MTRSQILTLADQIDQLVISLGAEEVAPGYFDLWGSCLEAQPATDGVYLRYFAPDKPTFRVTVPSDRVEPTLKGMRRLMEKE